MTACTTHLQHASGSQHSLIPGCSAVKHLWPPVCPAKSVIILRLCRGSHTPPGEHRASSHASGRSDGGLGRLCVARRQHRQRLQPADGGLGLEARRLVCARHHARRELAGCGGLRPHIMGDIGNFYGYRVKPKSDAVAEPAVQTSACRQVLLQHMLLSPTLSALLRSGRPTIATAAVCAFSAFAVAAIPAPAACETVVQRHVKTTPGQGISMSCHNTCLSIREFGVPGMLPVQQAEHRSSPQPATPCKNPCRPAATRRPQRQPAGTISPDPKPQIPEMARRPTPPPLWPWQPCRRPPGRCSAPCHPAAPTASCPAPKMIHSRCTIVRCNITDCLAVSIPAT